MKTKWGLFLAAFILIALIVGCSSGQQGGQSKEDEDSEKGAPTTTAPRTTAEATKASTTASKTARNDQVLRGFDETVTVTRVVDGDTVDISPAVDGNSRVRLIGVDTPETKDPDCGVQPYGEEASNFTDSRLRGKRVGLEFDVAKTDRFDRLLAYVYPSNDEMFNETLLREGYAQVATFPPNVKYVDRFLAAQEEAREAGRGLWGLSPEELALETDRGNGIGGAGCVEEAQPPEPPPSTPTTEVPTDVPNPDVPTDVPNPDLPSPEPEPSPAAPAAPQTPSLANGADCSTGVKDVPVVPGSKGDRDGDGIACET